MRLSILDLLNSTGLERKADDGGREENLPRHHTDRPRTRVVTALCDQRLLVGRVSLQDFASNNPEDEFGESIPDGERSELEDLDADEPSPGEPDKSVVGEKTAPGKAKPPPVTTCKYADW